MLLIWGGKEHGQSTGHQWKQIGDQFVLISWTALGYYYYTSLPVRKGQPLHLTFIYQIV